MSQQPNGSGVLQGLLGRGIAKIGGLAVDPYVNIKLGGAPFGCVL